MASRSRRLAAVAAFGGSALLLVASTGAALADVDPATGLGLRALASQGALALLVLGGAFLVEAPRRERLGWVRGRLRGGVPIVAALGFVASSAAVDAALELSGLRAASQLGAIDRVLGSARGAAVPLLLLGLVVAPPVCEELLFRGLVQPRLVRGLGPVAGVTLTAALFGASHLDPVHVAGAFALGIYLGLVALLDGSIRTAILCHGLNNALAVGAAALGARAQGSGGGIARLTVGLALAALALEVARRGARRAAAAEPPGALSPGPGTDAPGRGEA